MAVGPNGSKLDEPRAEEAQGVAPEHLEFLRGLEGIIDRALQSHPSGDTFVYGIHQGMDPAVVDLLVRRYRAAGWSEAKAKPVLTGAVTLILIP